MALVEQFTAVSPAALRDLNMLVAALRGETASAGTIEGLECIVHDPDSVLVCARDGDRIVGMGMLFVMHKVGKRKGFIEDVVVAESHRGQGIGKHIMQKLIELSRERGVHTLQLSSGHERVAAHALYEKLGFKKQDTHLYRLK